MMRRCLSAVAGGLLFVELFLPRLASAAPDNTLGVALFMAVIDSNGTIGRSSGVTSAQRLAVGEYEVIFDRDVTECAFVSSVGNSTTLNSDGTASAARRNNIPTGVFVKTFNAAGAVSDRAFHLIVFCPK